MKAAFFDGLGQMQVMDYPDPKPQSGEAIVQVKATGICGSDLLLNNDKTAPDDIRPIETGNGQWHLEWAN